jgi:hypothetical protein
MNTRQNSTVEFCADGLAQAGALSQTLRPSFLYLVNEHELEELRDALARGVLPPDFEAKLERLEQGDLMHRFVARNCRLFAALLLADRNGFFKEPSRANCERLLRVLAYVRKDEDAVPDYKPGGFTDDQREVLAAVTDLHRLLKSFKAWRLRHQVPGMWLGPTLQPPQPLRQAHSPSTASSQ